MIKQIIKSFLGSVGLEVRYKQKKSKYGFHFNIEMDKGLARFNSLGLPVKTIVDIGAAQGSWSLLAERYWTNQAYLLFEPLEERQKELSDIAKSRLNFHITAAAAGRESGTIYLSVSDDLDGSGVTSDPSHLKTRSVNVVSIDNEVARLGLQGPYVIKLDTHGFEIPILEGCASILDQVSLFIIECYGFKIADNSLLFSEMCAYMDGLGFRLFDLVDVMNRPKDGAFWQCDAFFLKKNHTLYSDNKYA